MRALLALCLLPALQVRVDLHVVRERQAGPIALEPLEPLGSGEF